MSLRRFVIVFVAALHVLGLSATALAQEIEIDQVEESGGTWTLPALGVILALAIGVVFYVVKKRNTTTSIDDRLPSTPEEEPEVRNPVAAQAIKEPVDASPDVLRLLDNPAVTPKPGGAADLSADPWS